VPALLPPTSMRDSCTAGACAMIAQKSRALGNDSSCFASKMVAVFVDDTSTTGDAPLTVTVSCSDATFNSMLTVAVNPTPTLMPSRITVPKPPSSYCSA
jgi:putative sterol carrier protein